MLGIMMVLTVAYPKPVRPVYHLWLRDIHILGKMKKATGIPRHGRLCNSEAANTAGVFGSPPVAKRMTGLLPAI